MFRYCPLRNCQDQQLIDIDFEGMFERLELAENLSPNRHVGVYAILDKIYSQARALTSRAA